MVRFTSYWYFSWLGQIHLTIAFPLRCRTEAPCSSRELCVATGGLVRFWLGQILKKFRVQKIIDCPIFGKFDDDLPVPYIGGGVGRSCFSANPWQLVSSPNSARGSRVHPGYTLGLAVLSTGVEAEYVCTLTPRLHRRVRGLTGLRASSRFPFGRLSLCTALLTGSFVR